MKKTIILMLCAMLLLCACQKTPELGGYKAENGLWYIDFEDPTQKNEAKSIEVTLSDKTKGTAEMVLPILNVDLEGTNALTEKIKSDYEKKYGDYFKKPDDKIVKVSYTTEDVNDILVILMHEEITTPEASYTTTYSYYYDSLSDCELDMTEFCNTNGAQLATVFKAWYDSEWTKEYKKEMGHYPSEELVTAISCKGELVFDIYCTNTDGITQTKLTLQAEDVPLDLSQFETGE